MDRPRARDGKAPPPRDWLDRQERYDGTLDVHVHDHVYVHVHVPRPGPRLRPRSRPRPRPRGWSDRDRPRSPIYIRPARRPALPARAAPPPVRRSPRREPGALQAPPVVVVVVDAGRERGRRRSRGRGRGRGRGRERNVDARRGRGQSVVVPRGRPPVSPSPLASSAPVLHDGRIESHRARRAGPRRPHRAGRGGRRHAGPHPHPPRTRRRAAAAERGRPGHQAKARGLFGRARDLLASVVERGLNLPDAAERIRTLGRRLPPLRAARPRRSPP